MAVYDAAIIGSGFSGLMTVANIVRGAAAGRVLSLALIGDDPAGAFGPAYATPRAEHLLNVPAGNMGAYAENPGHFHDWLHTQGIDAQPSDFMPRLIYGRYLADIWQETLALARRKGLTLERHVATVTDIDEKSGGFTLHCEDGKTITARNVVLATGNTLKKQEGAQPAALIRHPWQFDFSTLAAAPENIALIGSGLTAADTIISLLDAGFSGQITVFSRSGLLPRAHPDPRDNAAVPPYQTADFARLRLSGILHRLRRDMRDKNIPWHDAVDGLRPLTQSLWTGLSAADKQRLTRKYFTLWNVHRHRYAPHIGRRIDAAIAQGRIKIIRSRVSGMQAAPESGIILSFPRLPQARFDLAFECIGVDYRILDMPLYKNMAAKGLVTPLPPYGIGVDGGFATHRGPAGGIYALGTPLFGQFFETTAVPELRRQAAAVAESLLQDFR
jgi:uncharacterized NAD(P)/FAD-binding protein YdhS